MSEMSQQDSVKMQIARKARDAREEKLASNSTFDSDLLANIRASREANKKAGLTPQESPLSYGQMFSMALSNTPKSASQFVEDTFAPVLSPLETVDSIYTLGKGLVQLAIPGEQADEETARAVGTYFANRYGGLENFKRTFANDPVGLLGDVSMIVTGGGTAAARLPGVLGKVGNKVKQVGQAIDPLNVGVQLAGATGRNLSAAVPAIIGTTTGAGSESIKQAFNAGKAGGDQQSAFVSNMRGEEDINAVVQDAIAAMGEMRATRGENFRTGKSALELETIPVNLDGIATAFGDFAKGLSFEGMSELSPKGTAKLVEIGQIISDWQKSPGLHNAKGLDMLKRRIDNAYPEGINL